jgi:integrase/recombinase XerD
MALGSNPDVKQFSAWQMREREVKAHIVNRRLSALSTFYRWLVRNGVVESDPVALAEKPKRPLRIPVWLEKEEQAQLEATIRIGAISRSMFLATTKNT